MLSVVSCPQSGLLSVFYEMEGDVFEHSDRLGCACSIFRMFRSWLAADSLQPVPHIWQFSSCRLSFTEILTLPERESPWKKDLPRDEGEDDDAYSDLLGDSNLDHRILGYASSLQDDVHGRKDVRHLLTIDTDDNPGWIWGDTGLLYFTMRDEDLQRHRFDRVKLTFQEC